MQWRRSSNDLKKSTTSYSEILGHLNVLGCVRESPNFIFVFHAVFGFDPFCTRHFYNFIFYHRYDLLSVTETNVPSLTTHQTTEEWGI